MIHRSWMVLLGSASMCCFLMVGPTWAIPKHDIDVKWGKAPLQNKYDKKYDHDDDYEKYEKYAGKGKSTSSEKYVKKDYEKWPDKGGWGSYDKKYKDHDDKKWGYGHGKHYDWKDPDCDPPVATPEPATLLLLGSTLAAGIYARRRRP